LGMGSAGAVCPSIPKDQFSGPALIKAYSYISIAMAVTPVLAPVLGGYLQYYISWRANFSFLAIYSFLIFVLFYFKLFETNPHIQHNRFSLKKMFINYKTILTDLKVLGAFVSLMAVFSGEIAYCTSLPFIVQHTLKLSSIGNGWLMIITAIGVIIGGLASSRLSSKLNSEKLLLIGILFVMMGSVLMFILAFMNIINIYVIVGPMTIYIIGTGMIYPNCIAKVMDLYPEMAGVIGSLLSSLQMLAAGIGIGIIANFNPFNQKSLAVLITIAGIVAISAYLFLIRGKKIPHLLIAEQAKELKKVGNADHLAQS
jgi:DHA1 family 2-module integral membrane pump EmrD-like MFS transporter